MKKVLSVAMASAMVLGMGANAFAIQYNVSSNDTAKWDDSLRFYGDLFVTDKDGNLKKEATTAIEEEETADFAPGDVIWMPLWADDQMQYTVKGNTADTEAEAGVKNLKVADVTTTEYTGYYLSGGIYYRYGDNVKFNSNGKLRPNDYAVATGKTIPNSTTELYNIHAVNVPESISLPSKFEGREYDNVKYCVGTKSYKENNDEYKKAVAENAGKDAYITVDVKEIKAADGESGKIVATDDYKDGVYTGPIDKNWSINLKDATNAVEEIVEKAELYRATAEDHKNYNTALNGVYVKVTLKDEWKHIDEPVVKYYVYVAENGTENKTNQVWVSGTYANDNVKEVNFDWTNNANTPAVWEAKDTGIAVFDYNDKAFFTVKMYEGEKLYLDLKTAYDRLTANSIYDATGADVEAFYNFVTADQNFSREGELVLVTDDETLVPYEVDADGNLTEVDAEYVKGYQIAHTKEKVNGFKFNTKELGNYILSEEIVVEEEVEEPEVEEPATETPAEPEAPVVEEKPNPNTGAEDFVGLAVSLAVVSVAAAGALALKK